MFGALEGEKHYFLFELGLPKTRNCLHFDVLEGKNLEFLSMDGPKCVRVSKKP